MSVWVQKIKAGDKLVYKELFDEFYQTLCVFASKYLKDDAMAADVVQDTFIKFWEHHADFDHSIKIKSYLYTSVRNACLNILRDKKEFVPDGESFDRLEKELILKTLCWNAKVFACFIGLSILYRSKAGRLFIWRSMEKRIIKLPKS